MVLTACRTILHNKTGTCHWVWLSQRGSSLWHAGHRYKVRVPLHNQLLQLWLWQEAVRYIYICWCFNLDQNY